MTCTKKLQMISWFSGTPIVLGNVANLQSWLVSNFLVETRLVLVQSLVNLVH